MSRQMGEQIKVTALAGGVGAAKLIDGLASLLPPENLRIIVNTGDDYEFFGLHVSPDIDIITYTLAGIVDQEKGWGIKNDTFRCLEMLGRYGYETWFKLGDVDLATHIHRTYMLRSGKRLSEVTEDIRLKLGVKQKIIPMTDDRFATFIKTDQGIMHFQEYLVKRGCMDKVLGIVYEGAEDAKPAPGVIESIRDADLIIICPSNPLVSIGTILSVKGVRDEIRMSGALKVAITPIVGGKPLKGPADKLMAGLGMDVSALSVAKLYSDMIDIFVLDEIDADLAKDIRALGMEVVITNTVMKDKEDRVRLARFVLDLLNLGL